MVVIKTNGMASVLELLRKEENKDYRIPICLRKVDLKVGITDLRKKLYKNPVNLICLIKKDRAQKMCDF